MLVLCFLSIVQGSIYNFQFNFTVIIPLFTFRSSSFYPKAARSSSTLLSFGNEFPDKSHQNVIMIAMYENCMANDTERSDVIVDVQLNVVIRKSPFFMIKTFCIVPEQFDEKLD